MNRKVFFDHVRKSPFGGVLKAEQVAGLNALLDVWEARYRQRTPITQLAYCLATTFHETARTMRPIREHGNAAYFTRMYDIRGLRPKVAMSLGNSQPGDGAKYCGRGFVQLTGRANYAKASAKLGVDLVTFPDRAMEPANAARILFEGMEEKWFTGLGLDDVIDPIIDGDEYADALKARRIINGTDRAALIAGHNSAFLAALRAAGADTLASAPPVAKQDTRPPTLQPARSWWARLFGK